MDKEEAQRLPLAFFPQFHNEACTANLWKSPGTA